MSDNQTSSVLSRLSEIARIDVLLTGLSGQLKALEMDLDARKKSIAQSEAKKGTKAKLLDDRRSSVSREEKSIKLERDKLNERRRSLATLSNYKLQQAAEREIDFVSKQMGKREELLLTVMREVEVLEKEVGELDSVVAEMRSELSGFEKEASEASETLKAKVAEYSATRAEQAEEFKGSPLLTQYTRTLTRYPLDPIVEVANQESCSGCFIRVGPQVLVQISRGDIVKCPGCGRILTLPAEQ